MNHTGNHSASENNTKGENIFSQSNLLFYLAGIVLFTFLVFSGTLHNDFINNWDDQDYVLINKHIQRLSFENIRLFFTEFYVGNYQPLTLLSYAMDYHFFGLNPMGYHLHNLLLHLLNVILVFFVIFKLSGRLYVSAIVSLLFGIHPMHVESVAWISERKDVLYSFFYLAALLSYIEYILKNQKKYLIFSFVFFLFSLLSKSMAVTLPVLFVLMDYYYSRKITRKSLETKFPFFVLSFIFGIIAMISQGHSDTLLLTATESSLFNRLLFPLYNVIYYIIKIFYPSHLSILHPYPEAATILPLKYYLAFALFLILPAGIYKAGAYRKELIFCFLFFLITILPVLQIIPIGANIVSERYTYVSYIGLFFGINILFNLHSTGKYVFTGILKISFLVLMASCLLIFSYTSWERNKIWKNGITLFSDAVKKYPNSALAYYKLGYAYEIYKQFPQAMEYMNKAIILDKKFSDAYNQRGIINMEMKNITGALNDFNMAVRLRPDYFKSVNNRGVAKYLLKDYKGAAEDFKRGLQLNPSDTRAEQYLIYIQKILSEQSEQDHSNNKYRQQAEKWFHSGTLKFKEKDFYGSLQDYTQAIELDSLYFQAYNERGVVKASLKRTKEAIDDFTKSFSINPDFTDALINRGVSKFMLNDLKGSMQDFNRALEINPALHNALYFRGILKKSRKDLRGACEDWRKAMRLGNKPAEEMVTKFCH